METPTPTNTSAREQTPAHVPQVLFAWSAPSHHNHERSTRWYVISGVTIVIVAGYGVLTGAWTLALVSLLIGGVYFLVRREPTALKDIRIERDGVDFEGRFTPWAQCKEFWLVRTPLYTELHIMRGGPGPREIRIQTGDIDSTALRSSLSRFLAMKADQREPLLDVIIRICKL